MMYPFCIYFISSLNPGLSFIYLQVIDQGFPINKAIAWSGTSTKYAALRERVRRHEHNVAASTTEVDIVAAASLASKFAHPPADPIDISKITNPTTTSSKQQRGRRKSPPGLEAVSLVNLGGSTSTRDRRSGMPQLKSCLDG